MYVQKNVIRFDPQLLQKSLNTFIGSLIQCPRYKLLPTKIIDIVMLVTNCNKILGNWLLNMVYYRPLQLFFLKEGGNGTYLTWWPRNERVKNSTSLTEKHRIEFITHMSWLSSEVCPLLSLHTVSKIRVADTRVAILPSTEALFSVI